MPTQTDSSAQNEIAIAQHVCEENDYRWVELWAIPNDKSHVSDQWHTCWRLIDDDGRVLLEYFGFCPYCGLYLDDQVDINGYYKHVGHDIEAEIAGL